MNGRQQLLSVSIPVALNDPLMPWKVIFVIDFMNTSRYSVVTKS